MGLIFMSNENSTTNSPRRKPKPNVKSRIRTGGNPNSGRSRKFSCITYLHEFQILSVIAQHRNQIRVYAYAYHDKDTKEDGTLKEPHIHLILVTYSPCTVTAIRRWFSGFKDDKGQEITTTAQICTDVFQMYDYLTHSTIEAIKGGKYQYDKSIVKTNDLCGPSAYFRASEESDYDNITLATEELLKGAKIQDLGKRYGRDFILHYTTIKKYVSDIMLLESGMSFERMCEIENVAQEQLYKEFLDKRLKGELKK